MREPRHNLNSPFTHPPTGSELARICDWLEREASTSGVPSTLQGFMMQHMHTLVGEMLLQKGMPSEWMYNPPLWLEELIHTKVQMFQLVLAENPSCIEPKRCRGRPGPATFPLLVGINEYLRQRAAAPSGTSEDALYKATARTLGPGINRDHMRRLLSRVCSQLGWLQHNDAEGFKSTLQAFLVVGAEIERFRQITKTMAAR